MNTIALLLLQSILFPQQNDISLQVTDSEIQQDWVFFAPHENELIVESYLTEQVIKHGGKFVVLRQNGERNIRLRIDKSVYQIDPNRIFTERGRKNTLLKLNPNLHSNSDHLQKALEKTADLADFILEAMDAQGSNSWIAIHNNTNGYKDDGKDGRGTISIKRYKKHLNKGASYLIKVHDANIDEDDLFFITEQSDFERMAVANWNVVLQNPKVAHDPSEDDGSLSVLAEMKDKRYINIEAERADDGYGKNHLEQQKAMVDLSIEILKASK